MPPAPGPRGSPAAGGVSGALAPMVSVQGMENCSLPGPEPAHLPQVTEHRRGHGSGERASWGLRTNHPLCLWVLGDSQGLNEGEEAGAGVGAGVHCHPSALPQAGGGGAPHTCSRTGLAGRTPVPHCFLSGALTGISQAWETGERGLEGWAGHMGYKGR